MWQHGIIYPTEMEAFSDSQITVLLQVQSLNNLYEGRFKFFETLRHIDRWNIIGVSKDRSVCVFSVKQSKMNACLTPKENELLKPR
jgi:hypothetical protein